MSNERKRGTILQVEKVVGETVGGVGEGMKKHYNDFLDLADLDHVVTRWYSPWRRFKIWSCKMWTPVRNGLGLAYSWPWNLWGTHNEAVDVEPLVYEHHGFTFHAYWHKCRNCGGLSTGNVKPFTIPARSTWHSGGHYECLDCNFATDSEQEMIAHSGRQCAEQWPEVI